MKHVTIDITPDDVYVLFTQIVEGRRDSLTWTFDSDEGEAIDITFVATIDEENI